MSNPRVTIIGGGAAGLTAAIAAARAGARVTLLDGGPRVGRKILASGNGRCNLTNALVAPSAYNRPEFVEPVVSAWSADDICSFFGDIGLLTYADDESRVYPVTNAANSVLDVLRLECVRLGVKTRLGFQALRVTVAGPGQADAFAVLSADGDRVVADAVIVATGGGKSLLEDLGHELVECVPVLGPIKTDVESIRRLSGIRVRCSATMLDDTGTPLATERGELLFRDYGVSGIMIFDLSRCLDAGRVLSIDFFPDVASDELETMLAKRAENLASRTAETFLDGMLHHTVAQAVLGVAEIAPETPVAQLAVEPLAKLLKDFRLDVLGAGDPKQAQVMRGGASVDEFDATTLESRLVPALFAAGEVLDIDGRCGGFNLHWAWASGVVAGQNAARAAEASGAAQ